MGALHAARSWTQRSLRVPPDPRYSTISVIICHKTINMLMQCDAKRSNDSRAAKPCAAASEDLLKCDSQGHRNKGKELLTFRKPGVHRDLQRDALPSAANP